MARKARPGILAVYAVIVGPRTWRSLKIALDTGATYTMVPPDLLLDIGYNPLKAARYLELATASGLVMAPVLRIHSLKCLGLVIKDTEVVAHHLPPESPVEGLLGLNVLTRFQPFRHFVNSIRSYLISP